MNTKRSITLLVLASVLIYGLQLVIFHDPRNTYFYIFQDMAFMPITIAITTLVVGQVMEMRAKRDRLEKTQMLTSSFYTELGTALMFELLGHTDGIEEVKKLLSESDIQDCTSLKKLQKQLGEIPLRVHLSEETYARVKSMILEKQTILIVISSNPLLLEHEEFTSMLWGLFHLIDEFRLRGDYAQLSKEELMHLEKDVAHVLLLLISSWTGNALYTKKHYPNYYNAALSKLQTRI